jgi:hypothetical protein
MADPVAVWWWGRYGLGGWRAARGPDKPTRRACKNRYQISLVLRPDVPHFLCGATRLPNPRIGQPALWEAM